MTLISDDYDVVLDEIRSRSLPSPFDELRKAGLDLPSKANTQLYACDEKREILLISHGTRFAYWAIYEADEMDQYWLLFRRMGVAHDGPHRS